MRTIAITIAIAIMLPAALNAKDYKVLSPDGRTEVVVSEGKPLVWSVSRCGELLLSPSEISLKLEDGSVYGSGSRFRIALRNKVDRTVGAPLYKRSSVHEHYNELRLVAKEFDLVFRVADDGVAYRFVTHKAVTVLEETAVFNFPDDFMSWVPYANENGGWNQQMQSSFENHYSVVPLSGWDPSRLAILPVTFAAESGVKLCITETDLFNYPGMYLANTDGSRSLRGVFAAYPKEIGQGGHNMLQGIVKSRENYIYKGSSGEALPWRVMVIAEDDKDLIESDFVWSITAPSQGDYSWVRPGKVAWDWWNDWNLRGVDFEAGINNETYKYYIDFAASKGIEYVILDEGWAVNLKADLFQVIPEIDIAELCSYARNKGVDIVLWAGYWAFDRDMDAICEHYARLGVAGWKIDFMNRDDQAMVAFFERAARTAAKYHQIVDFHGAFKPSGLIRKWPNVVNHEGVAGLEQMKWAAEDYDQVVYDVTIPFVRLVAGPCDYTQGAMRNAAKGSYHPIWSEPMSQGTRMRQLAEYIVFDAPFTMLCDSPSNYLAEPECTDFIASIPTVWDETVALDGKIGEYVVIARRSGAKWYVAAMTDWSERDITIDLSKIPAPNKATLWRDGVNASRNAMDYRKEEVLVPGNSITVHLAPGGACILEF